MHAFPIVKELRTHLDMESFLKLTAQMKVDGYRLFAIHNDGIMVGVAGFAIRSNFYYGKYVFVYDLVTSHIYRSKGYGEKILRYIHNLGKENDCDMVVLESGLKRLDAHRFYENKMGYEKFCFSFTKKLG